MGQPRAASVCSGQLGPSGAWSVQWVAFGDVQGAAGLADWIGGGPMCVWDAVGQRGRLVGLAGGAGFGDGSKSSFRAQRSVDPKSMLH
ncbi:hypothetical protein [Thalassospira sp. MCCC 1A03138]|uniref:hypothetical protein n=1 Tax=Thalassospira sp. MCCC 1A03138 TaxID=1470576 RepID=UPI00111C718D|nr:hypothetical protein [Thalassospira sp. MCCC 1A03138]